MFVCVCCCKNICSGNQHYFSPLTLPYLSILNLPLYAHTNTHTLANTYAQECKAYEQHHKQVNKKKKKIIRILSDARKGPLYYILKIVFLKYVISLSLGHHRHHHSRDRAKQDIYHYYIEEFNSNGGDKCVTEWSMFG